MRVTPRRWRRVCGGALLASVACGGEADEFRTLAVLDVGQNPHQIAFTADGETAFIAAAGSDRVTTVDVNSLTVVGHIPVGDTPLGVAVLPDGQGIAVSRFGADVVARFAFDAAEPTGALETGGAPSLLVGPLPEDRYLVSVEQANKMWVMNAAEFTLEVAYSTGNRPFPPAATSDGRMAFAPNYDDGTVSVIDLENHAVIDTVAVGERPSGGAVLPGDAVYAVAVRGDNKVLFIDTASHDVVDSVIDGIGESPFSVVVTADGRLAFVNNTASHDVSVIALPEREVIARLPVGEQPIVMNVHPFGATLWVSSEGSHELTVLEIPRRWRSEAGVSSSGTARNRP